jgi:hypothetical protein
MNKIAIATAACCALSATIAFAGPFDAFQGKMKPGMYETKVDMDMGAVPGVPPGMSKQSTTQQHCVSDKDIEEGGFGKSRDKRGEGDCDFKDVKVSGNSATYKMVCPKSSMSAEGKMTFTGSGYVMDIDMTMDQGGHKMNMKQHTEGKYVGPCTK